MKSYRNTFLYQLLLGLGLLLVSASLMAAGFQVVDDESSSQRSKATSSRSQEPSITGISFKAKILKLPAGTQEELTFKIRPVVAREDDHTTYGKTQFESYTVKKRFKRVHLWGSVPRLVVPLPAGEYEVELSGLSQHVQAKEKALIKTVVVNPDRLNKVRYLLRYDEDVEPSVVQLSLQPKKVPERIIRMALNLKISEPLGRKSSSKRPYLFHEMKLAVRADGKVDILTPDKNAPLPISASFYEEGLQLEGLRSGDYEITIDVSEKGRRYHRLKEKFKVAQNMTLRKTLVFDYPTIHTPPEFIAQAEPVVEEAEEPVSEVIAEEVDAAPLPADGSVTVRVPLEEVYKHRLPNMSGSSGSLGATLHFELKAEGVSLISLQTMLPPSLDEEAMEMGPIVYKTTGSLKDVLSYGATYEEDNAVFSVSNLPIQAYEMNITVGHGQLHNFREFELTADKKSLDFDSRLIGDKE